MTVKVQFSYKNEQEEVVSTSITVIYNSDSTLLNILSEALSDHPDVISVQIAEQHENIEVLKGEGVE